MKKAIHCVALAALLTFVTSTAHAVIPLPFRTNVGSGSDTDPLTGFGAVATAYSIATTEVTNVQYAAFLNSVVGSVSDLAIFDSFKTAVWDSDMNITRNPDPPVLSMGTYNFTYTVDSGFESKPVQVVSFFSAMRFVNWLENGQPTGDLATTTNMGTYDISDGTSEMREADARFFLPSEDEWYRAAYHDPRTALEGGPPGDDHYWLYPTQSDTAPDVVAPSSFGSNNANYDGATAGMAMATTSVGAYPNSSSYYGGLDFGGNLWEWTEGTFGTDDRITRGGDFSSDATTLAATGRSNVDPGGGSGAGGFGFRIASSDIIVPEPATAVLAVIAALLLLLGSGRRFQQRTR